MMVAAAVCTQLGKAPLGQFHIEIAYQIWPIADFFPSNSVE